MNCKSVQTNISAYLDQELTRSEMLEIRAHIAGCETCQEEELSVLTLKSLLCEGPTVEPSADFEERLLLSVMGDRSPAAQQRQKISYWMLTSVAAAAMIFTLLILPSVHDNAQRKREVADQRSEVASEFVRNQMIEVSSDPLSGQPIISPAYDKR
jgi:anti-sigma factor RsiW